MVDGDLFKLDYSDSGFRRFTLHLRAVHPGINGSILIQFHRINNYSEYWLLITLI